MRRGGAAGCKRVGALAAPAWKWAKAGEEAMLDQAIVDGEEDRPAADPQEALGKIGKPLAGNLGPDKAGPRRGI